MFETLLGALVLIVAGIFLALAYSSAHLDASGGYELSATFDHVDGIRDGGDVRISGIKIGTIESQALDPKTYQAVVRMRIDNAVHVPVDTVATIASSGLLGDKFMQLVPGNEDKMLEAGGAIRMTQAPVSLESLLGQMVYSIGGKGKDGNGGATQGPSPSPSSSPTPSAAPGNGPSHS